MMLNGVGAGGDPLECRRAYGFWKRRVDFSPITPRLSFVIAGREQIISMADKLGARFAPR